MTTEDDITQPIGSAHPSWLAYARSQLGQREVSGSGDNLYIVECLRLAGLPASMQHDATAWCGAFACRCMIESGIEPPKGPAAARHWLRWGEPLAAPVEGAVAVFWRGSPTAPTGHVGFVVGVGPGPVLQVLGGNQGNEVSVRAYAKARLLGLRWPPGTTLPTRMREFA